MISYLAVVFFCINGDCYFYNGNKLHNSLGACASEVKAAEEVIKRQKVETYSQCLKISVTGA